MVYKCPVVKVFLNCAAIIYKNNNQSLMKELKCGWEKVCKSEEAFIEKERPFCFGLCDLICKYVRDFVLFIKLFSH